VAAIADEIPPLTVDSEPGAELLVLGWGSTEGSIRAGVRMAREAGYRVACAQLRHLSPLPSNTGDVLRSFERVLVPELNAGQLASVLRGRFLVDVESFTKIQGQPLFAGEILDQIAERQRGASIVARGEHR
jgi:2-oxoglutarate ferredoxin oxidoreductase subunit alpha